MTNLTPAQAKAIALIKEQYKDAKEFNAPHDYQARRSVGRNVMQALVNKGIIKVATSKFARVNGYGQRSEFSDSGRQVLTVSYTWA